MRFKNFLIISLLVASTSCSHLNEDHELHQSSTLVAKLNEYNRLILANHSSVDYEEDKLLFVTTNRSAFPEVDLSLMDSARFGKYRVLILDSGGRQVPDLVEELNSQNMDQDGIYCVSPMSHAMQFIVTEPDMIDSIDSIASDYPAQWGHKIIGCSSAWDETIGSPSIRVGLIDTGVRLTHQELSKNVLDPETNFPSQKLDLHDLDNTVADSDGHGTFIAGLISADETNEIAMMGVAPGCDVIPIRVASNLSVSTMKLIEGALLAAELGARVINYSWASKLPFPLEEEMCNMLEEQGVLLVCSAGNEGDDTPWYPAAYPTALSVGATDAFDARVPELSNYGPAVDIAAPGIFLKSTWHEADDSYIEAGFGTSYAAAFVSGAAALLLSEDPTLTPAEIRELLISSGAPTTGFGEHPTPRLDIAAAFEQLKQPQISLPPLEALVQSGNLQLEPDVSGDPGRLGAGIRGMELDTATAAPWQLELDLTGLPFGEHVLSLRTGQGSPAETLDIPVLVDNDPIGRFPWADDFTSPFCVTAPLDAKSYSAALLAELRQDDPGGWSAQQLMEAGPGEWHWDAGADFSNTGALAIAIDGEPGYGAWETDVLASPLLDLATASQPELLFRTHWNLEEGRDFGHILASTDGGRQFSLLQLADATPASLTGYEPDWQELRVDLSPYAGQQLHLFWLLQSDATGSGEEQSAPAGWWIDDIELQESGEPAFARIGDCGLWDWDLLGTVPDRPLVDLHFSGVTKADRVFYDLLPRPFDTGGTPLLHLESTDKENGFLVNLDMSGYGNRMALLRITPWLDGQPGSAREYPLWLFNHKGDADADGQVDTADLDFIRERLGAALHDPDFDYLRYDVGLGPASGYYTPFADSDLDWGITEADAAAVGYFWNP